MTSSQLDLRVERLLRDLAPQVLGAVLRRFGDFAESEDAVQEALIAAAAQWPRDGVPDNPRGWLIQVARRRMIDFVRSESSRRDREAVVADETSDFIAPAMSEDPETDPDDTLVLLFMCCHSALTPASAIALTLRAVGGLTTAEIAKAFLVPESTIAQRISRAKQSIRTSRVPFRMPDAEERAQRLSSVLHVLYLVFNEGYTTSSGAQLHRTDLSNEVIRLTRQVHMLLPNNGEVAGLLALMFLTDARRTARTGAGGALIPLDEQDRAFTGTTPASALGLAGLSVHADRRPSMSSSCRPLISLACFALMVGAAAPARAQAGGSAVVIDTTYIGTHYEKREVMVPVRDGVKLFTAIYSPKASSGAYPLLLTRTPYSAAPYGPAIYPRYLGPGRAFPEAGYIFVTQDVRGRYRSEGRFEHMTPHRDVKRGPKDVDESTDTYDTIAWLVSNVAGNNGRVGLWGISYGGFFAAAGMIDAHPALKAVSPQAPQADWFLGDDTHHNGAFFLTSTFNFMAMCGKRGPGSSMTCGKPFDFGTDDGYDFFLKLGPLANAEKKYFRGSSPGWTDMMRHGNYDDFWKARNILAHIKGIKPAVLTVGGWYDANNFYGALHLFETIEKQSPETDNAIVIGPWYHGQWARDSGVAVGKLSFGARTSDRYQHDILMPFFESHLKGTGQAKHPKAYVFETGSNRWRTFEQWPPKESASQSIYLGAGNTLASEPPRATTGKAYEEWVTDPANPAPFVPGKSTDMDPDYMAQDQRFGAARLDVVSYRGQTLTADLTIAGPLSPTLFVSTTGTDGDWVVKLIDVHPDGFQELVRGDVVRAKFRKSFARPEPLTPGAVTQLDFTMPDVFHTFRRGHQMLVQMQGSWFPLVDRNPQTFVDIYKAKASDFRKASQRVYRTPTQSSRIVVRVLQERTIP